MDWLEFIAVIAGSLAWPVAIVIIVIILLRTNRKP